VQKAQKMIFLSFLEQLKTHKQAKNVYMKYDTSRGSNDFAILAVCVFTFQMPLSENK